MTATDTDIDTETTEVSTAETTDASETARPDGGTPDAADSGTTDATRATDTSGRQSPAVAATGPGTDTLLQTDGLTKRFGGFTAIDDVDFSVETGELRCLIGPNGAGKSTLLKLITGRHDATSGAIYYDGTDITTRRPNERVDLGIGMKFQVPSVFDELTAYENMRLSVQRTHADAHLDEAILDALERIDLAARATTPAGELSHGQQGRLEIGMAAALEPDLLLLDEPVAGLSVEERNEVADLVTELNDDGIAFIVIEHDIDFVAEIAHEVTVLHGGEVFREGSIEAIRDDDDVRRIYLGGE
ncbi:ABC transporter ATP-binding protein [Halarchaeum nitratireducens]|uniref:ABC transporter ATP-binding protein n=1 Tax=Halarchaeum nitratireducens TaxID=489913 RepID=A0A830G855_9EURY|nr:ABC transporter ATP-binding protein [Halarchaeum nitratireducens]GGN10898.1 ABC transporter ATP-binding protein [Halarchaeum nitratireducens]